MDTNPRAGLQGRAPDAARLMASPIRDVSRLIFSVVTDLRAVAEATAVMAESIRVLPEIAATMRSIDRKLDSVDGELARIRSDVDVMAPDVNGMALGVEELRDDLRPVAQLASRLPGGKRRAA